MPKEMDIYIKEESFFELEVSRNVWSLSELHFEQSSNQHLYKWVSAL